jgi:hypothetical protein
MGRERKNNILDQFSILKLNLQIIPFLLIELLKARNMNFKKKNQN